jgi:multicomponent Na+:H+ antiporter subunit D
VTNSPFPILIIVVPLISAFFIPIIGWWRKGLCYPLVIAALSLSALSCMVTLQTVMEQGTIYYYLGNWDPPWGIEYVIDHLNAFVAVIVSVISLIIAIGSKRNVEQELPQKTVYFYCLFLLQVGGLLGIVVTGDMFNLYVFLEIASLAGYALIAIGEDGAPFASFNYMIYGTIGACFYLLSVGYLYVVTGSLNMGDLSGILPGLYHSKVVLMAFAFFRSGCSLDDQSRGIRYDKDYLYGI